MKTIDEETDLLVEVMAQQPAESFVISKYEKLFGDTKIPNNYNLSNEIEAWIKYLCLRAEIHFANNKDFRKKVKGKGNKGRDYLSMFMHHWAGQTNGKLVNLQAEFSKKRWMDEHNSFKKEVR